MKAFAYLSPARLDEVAGLLADGADGDARVLAGGTDLLTLMKAGIENPDRLVNIKRVEGLSDQLEERPDGLVIGALATLSALEAHPAVIGRYPALAEAAAVAASPQLRNMATIGGNLLQRPRCWYFRDTRFHCWLKGGTTCHARGGENRYHALFGGGPCIAVHPSDPAPALLAYEAQVTIHGAAGERTIALADLFALPTEERRNETLLEKGDTIVSMRLPPPGAGMRGTYMKAMDRKAWAFALVGVAAVARFDGRAVGEARVVLGGVAPVPWRVRGVEAELAGSPIDERVAARVADMAVADAQPLAHNAYKVPLARALIKRALMSLA